MNEDFFLLDHHRERWKAKQSRKSFERKNWRVVSVEETDRVEEVFCTEVPTTGSFVLSGNVLTGNCFSCSGSGTIPWLVSACLGWSDDEVAKWLQEEWGAGGVQALAAILDFIETAFQKERPDRSIATYDMAMLDRWRKGGMLHPYMAERGVTDEVGERFLLGFDEEKQRVVIPHIWHGDLVGWQARTVEVDGEPKYKSSYAFPKDTTLYNFSAQADKIVVVESPMSVLVRHGRSPWPMVATFGATLTEDQLRLLSRIPRLVLWMDPDKAGRTATAKLIKRLEHHSILSVVDASGDPAEVSGDEFDEVLSTSIPSALWRPS